jgi:hypothetical protein
MKYFIFIIILLVTNSCTKDRSVFPSKLKGQILSDGKQTFYYTNDSLDYIENKDFGANTIKYFYKENKIYKLELYNVNGHIHTYHFKYDNEKLVQAVDSFVLWKTGDEEHKFATYEYPDPNKIDVTLTTMKNGVSLGNPKKYSIYIKNDNLIKFQDGESIDSFSYDLGTNPRYLIPGFKYLFDYYFLEYAGYAWIRNNSQNNIMKEFGRNIKSTSYSTIKNYYNTYSSNGQLLKVIGDINSSNYSYLTYKYYE